MINKLEKLVVFTMGLLLSLQPAAAQVKDYRDIKFPQIPEFKIDRPERFTLDNGMTVFLIEDHELPLIRVEARVRSGSNYEPAEKAGLTQLFEQLLREGGTGSMSGDEIDEFLESRAASIDTHVGGDSGTAAMDCLAENFDEVLSLFRDILSDPVFAQDKIDVTIGQAKAVIARRNDNVSGITRREFRKLIYGADSPLVREMEYATLAAIERDDLLAWHAKYYHPNNLYLGIVGDFDWKEMKGKITEQFKDWPRGPAISEPEVPYRTTTEPGVYFIEKTDVTQANIRMGHLGIRRNNPDYFAVEVMNEVLGGGFSGRLFKQVRSIKGLAYGVGGGVRSSELRPGVFGVGLSTKSESMGAAVEAVKTEISGMLTNPPSAEELQLAKASLINSFVFKFDSRSDILSERMRLAYYGYPEDYLESYRDRLEQVTGEDVARVAKKYIQPDKMTLLVVGNAEQFDRPLSSFGPVSEVDITIPDPPDTRAELVRSPENLAAGARLFERLARTLNGDDETPLQALRSKNTMQLSMAGQSISLGQEVTMKLPDKVRQAVSTPMGEQLIVINGGAGFMSMGGQQRPLPAEQAQEGAKMMARDLLVLASLRGNPELETVAAGKDQVQGSPCELVAVTYRGFESRLCVDESGKVLRQAFMGRHPVQGTPGMIEVELSDYREVDGHLLPHRHVMRISGEQFASLSLDSIEINPEVEATLFELPEGM